MSDAIKYGEELNIRELIKTTSIPYIYACDKNCPAYKLGYFTSGPRQEWIWDEKELAKMDELTLWKIYGLSQNYWFDLYESITNKCKKKLDALGIDWWRD